MAEIDFSKLEELAYPGINGAEARARKDELIAQGFRYVDEREYGGNQKPVTTLDQKQDSGRRDYRPLYREVYNFHERHSPPVVDVGYWKTHNPRTDEIPEAEQKYWDRTVEDLAQTAKDPFLIGLFSAVLGELEREYKRLRDQAIQQEETA